MTKDILIGPATKIGPLHVTPLMWQEMSRRTYSAPPIGDALVFSEIDDEDGARVEHIYVENDSREDFFLPSGWVIGGNLLQTRILNFDEFIAAGSGHVISVSCVEKGRWSGGVNPIDGGRAPISVAAAGWNYEPKNRAWEMNSGERQSKVWSQVSRQESRNGTRSTNSLMQVMSEDSKWDTTISNLRSEIDKKYSPMYGQNGVVISVGGSPLLMEFYSDEKIAQRIIHQTLKALTFDTEFESYNEVAQETISQFIAGSGIEQLHYLREEDWAILLGSGTECIDTKASMDSDEKFVHVSTINRNHRILLGV